jgi:hypothetical protein
VTFASSSSTGRDGGPSITDHTFYHVKNRYWVGYCLAVPGGSTQAGTRVFTYPCGNWADHWWKFDNYGENLRKIRPQHALDKCLAIEGGSETSGTAAIIWGCGEWADHYWRIEFQYNDRFGNGVYMIWNQNSWMCLTADEASGTDVYQSYWCGSNRSLWTLVPQ